MGKPILGTSVAIQGMGSVGGTTAQLLEQEGCRVVAVSDVSGGVYKRSGLNIAEIRSYLNDKPGNLLSGYSADGIKHITNEGLLTMDVDILIPAALENQITLDIAPRIRARVIIEAANGPTTHEADTILEKQNITVVPDILVNAGGVVVSYFEWVQNIQSLTWDEEAVNQTLERIMVRAFNAVWEEAVRSNIPLRMSAYKIALDRIVRAKHTRGVFP
jgi:glutamate dehydrogenase (NAD(P)+)